MLRVNQSVTTPIGIGVFQGKYEIISRLMGPVETCVAVRIELNDENRGHLVDSNCVTPRATHSALFVFAESQVKP